MNRERPLAVQVVHRGRLLMVRVETVALPNGRQAQREIVEHPGAVVMVPQRDDGKLLFVEQYRRAADRVLLELPAGTCRPEELPEETARRELVEECGQAAGRLIPLGAFFAAPGYSTELLHCYLAIDLRPASAPPDADEAITVVPLSLAEVRQRIAHGAFADAKTLAGLLLALPRLEGWPLDP
jgi:8-oxo-dGTP pyrophosphatase MutT (NUDIX family)